MVADTGFDGPKRLGIRITGWHIQLFPHFRHIFFFDTNQVQTLSAGYLHYLHIIFNGDISNPLQILRCSYTAIHPRNDGKCAVLLDVGTHTLINEARFLLVLMRVRIDHAEVIVHCRTAFGAALRLFPVQYIHDFLGSLESLGSNLGYNLITAECCTAANAGFGALLKAVAEDKLENLFHDRLTAAAGTCSTGAGFNLIYCGKSVLCHSINNCLLGHPVTAADDFFIGHRLNRHSLFGSAPAAAAGAHHFTVDLIGHLCALLHQLLQTGRFRYIAEQYRPDNNIVFKQNLLIGSLPFILGRNNSMLRCIRKLTRRKYVHSGNFQLR
ncbi:hypothetical protein D3C81_1274830 [compost metagenome]